MNDNGQADQLSREGLTKRQEVGLWLLGTLAFVVFSLMLEHEAGVPFDTTYRLACAAMCLFFIRRLYSDYPGQRWVTISFWTAGLVNVAILFTPLMKGPASRGELILFALPDAIVTLAVRIATYKVADDHQRAMRQQMVLGLIVAGVIFAGLFLLILREGR